MMLTVRIVAFVHLAVYLGIMWYGWQSYRLLRKRSWRFMGIGFTIFLLYRLRQFILLAAGDYRVDTEGILIPFIASVFLLAAFKMLSTEHRHLLNIMAEPSPLRSGAQPVEYWLAGIRTIAQEEAAVAARNALEEMREIMREEITAASGTTTVRVTGLAGAATPAETAED